MENTTYGEHFPHLSCLLALSFATILIYKWRSLIKTKRSLPLPPGPISFPLIGCLPTMIKNKPISLWIHRVMQEMDTEIACFRIVNSLIISVTSPELAREFFKKNDTVFASRPNAISARITSDGYLSALFSPYGDQWSKMRRVLVSEVLSSSTHKKFHSRRCEEADELIRYVHTQCQKPSGLVDVRTVTRHYCGNVIKKMVFGKRYFGLGDMDGGPGMEERQHMDALFTILSHVYGFAIADFVPWVEGFDFDGHKKILVDAVGTMKRYHNPEVDKRVDMWEKGIRTTQEDILDVLINLKDGKGNPMLTIGEIKAEIHEMILATVDNPSNAAEWSLAEMINQPHILEKACEELDRVVGRDRLVQESDLPKLNYIKACAKESFRLHPIAPFNVPHMSLKNVVVGGYLIPKGSQVLLSRPGLGRNPKAWQDPLTYNPERHLANGRDSQEVMLADHELRMLSFSTGRRGCPAIMLGSTVTAMLLGRLVHGFCWKAPPYGPEKIDLAEAERDNLSMKKPLIAHATPRLETQVYLNTYN